MLFILFVIINFYFVVLWIWQTMRPIWHVALSSLDLNFAFHLYYHLLMNSSWKRNKENFYNFPYSSCRFRSVAYLQQIWWFEVVGEIEFCFPAGTYSLFFRLHLGRPSRRLGRRTCGTEHVHGWDIKPVRFELSTSDDQHASSKYYLEEPGSWILYHVGDFVVANSDKLTKLRFSMTQIDCTHTKGGLCVDCALIYPKGFKHEKEVVVYM